MHTHTHTHKMSDSNKKQKVKKEILGRGRFKTVFLIKKNDGEYYAHSEGWALDQTLDPKLKYIIQGVDDFTTELGVPDDYNYITKTIQNKLHYYSQVVFSAFEMAYMNVGTMDSCSVQTVITRNYRYKRIDFDELAVKNRNTQYEILMLNLECALAYVDLEIPSVMDTLKLRWACEREKKLVKKVDDFFRYLCVFYEIKHIKEDHTLHVTKEEFMENSKKYDNLWTGTEYVRDTTWKWKGENVETAPREWGDFNYVFNELQPNYAGIMNYLEANVFDKNTEFKNKVDEQFRDMIESTELLLLE